MAERSNLSDPTWTRHCLAYLIDVADGDRRKEDVGQRGRRRVDRGHHSRLAELGSLLEDEEEGDDDRREHHACPEESPFRSTPAGCPPRITDAFKSLTITRIMLP